MSFAFIVHVAEAPADHKMKKISGDVAAAINQNSLRKSTSKTQMFKTEEFSIDFMRRS